MLQVRKLVLAVAAATAFTSGAAHALSLGDVSVKSYLGQPLEAEIELTDIRDLDSTEIKSQLASLEEFSRHGMERQFFLSNIKFTPVINQSGKSYIRVTSERAVNEPYVSFLLELYWPNGRALREYTLLMDPPMYSSQTLEREAETAAVEEKSAPEPQKAVAQKPQPDTPAAVRTAPRQQPQATAPARQPRAALNTGGQHKVARNESLWSIAERVEGDGSIYQKMIAIVDENPQAFIGGDINKLKAGAVLTLPDNDQIGQTSRAQAVSKYKDFQARPIAAGAGQLDARRLERAEQAPAVARTEDSLRLLSTETGENESGNESGSAADIQRLSAQLAETKEQLDSTMLENADLRERVQELGEQMERLQKLVELKNTQLASLQNMDPAELEQQNLDAQDVQAQPTAEAAPEPAEQEVAEQETIEQPEAAGQPAADLAQEQTEQVEEQTAKTEPVKPVVPVFEDEFYDKSFLDEMLDNPMFLPAAGGGVLVALVLLLLMARKRRAAKEAAELEAENLAYEQEHQFEQQPEQQADITAITEDTVVLDELDEEEPAPAVAPEAEQSFKQEKAEGGALAEADGYIAYGRFNEAASLLMQAIDAEPERVDLRFKLLEVFADLDDRNSFARQVSELEEMGGNQQQLEQMKTRYPDMFADSSAPVEAADDTMLDLDSLGLGLDEQQPSQGAQQLDEELDLSALDELEEAPQEQRQPESTGDELADFDFDQMLEEVSSAGDEPVTEVQTEPAAVAEPELEVEFEPELEAEPELDELSLTLNELEGLDESSEPEPAQTDGESDESLDFGLLDDFEAQLAAGNEQEQESSLDFSDDLDLALSEVLPESEDEPEPAQTLDSLTEDDELSADFDALNEELDSLAESMSNDVASDDELGSLLDEADELGSDFDLGNLDTELNIDELKLDDGLEELTFGTGATETLSDEPEAVADGLDDIGDLDLDAPFEDFASEQGSNELADSLGDDFDFLAGTDETTTKLDLARAYVDMGDSDGARDILDEVMAEGNDEHKAQAQELLDRLG